MNANIKEAKLFTIGNRESRVDLRFTKRMAHVASLSLLLIFACLAVHAQTATMAARGETIQFQSKLVGKTLPYNVLLPPDYASQAAQTTRYPVVYLLHGLFGHYTDWLARTKLSAYAAQHHLIIITPEGNNNWYTDSATIPADKYETYIMRELIPDVQKRFRTIEARDGRAIAGLSMGGYGALKFGVKYPDQFAFAASMSGALAAASWTETDLRKAEFVRPSVAAVFGAADNPARAANDLFKLTREVLTERLSSLPYFYLDCGTEDLLLASNRTLADIFLERKIPHEFRELPGRHDWKFWNAQVRDVLRIAEERLSPPQAVVKTTRLKAMLSVPSLMLAGKQSFSVSTHTGD